MPKKRRAADWAVLVDNSNSGIDIIDGGMDSGENSPVPRKGGITKKSQCSESCQAQSWRWKVRMQDRSEKIMECLCSLSGSMQCQSAE